MQSRLALLALVLVLAIPVLRAQQAVTAPGGFAPLERYLDPLREQAGIPGMSAAVVQDGEIIWEYGFGFQNVAARIRATPATPYPVGDLSDTFAAVLLLQCVEQRRLDLDEPLTRYGATLPEPDATLREVLSHSSPIPNANPFTYSPERYAQLTSVMEWCAPQPYRKSVAHRLLNRLAMTDSVPGTDLTDSNVVPDELFDQSDLERYRAVLRRMAIPYRTLSRGRFERTEFPRTGITAAGGLVSTVRDLAKFDAALDSSLLLTEDTLSLAWSQVVTSSGTVLPTGLGWFVQTYRGERVVWHFSLLPGAYSALMLRLPDRHLTFILLANSDGLSAPFQLAAGDVTRSVFATLFLRRATCAVAALC
jgi:CubicO group peptidase (beta-lactamase class C family)